MAGIGGVVGSAIRETMTRSCLAGSLDDVSLEDLQHRFVAVAKVQPRSAAVHTNAMNAFPDRVSRLSDHPSCDQLGATSRRLHR